MDANAERFVLAVNVIPADSILRYREGDFNETVYIKGDGNTPPASPEEIIALHKRKFGVDNEMTQTELNPINRICIYTLPNARITSQDIQNFNAQYPGLEVKRTSVFHARRYPGFFAQAMRKRSEDSRDSLGA